MRVDVAGSAAVLQTACGQNLPERLDVIIEHFRFCLSAGNIL
jgi:hypothetical protein